MSKKKKFPKLDDVASTDHRIIDEIGAKSVSAQLDLALDELKLAVNHIVETGVDLKALRQLLSENKEALERFFLINLILKGFLITLEGEEWERHCEAANHQYTPNIIKFLQDVHTENWNVSPPKPPKIITMK